MTKEKPASLSGSLLVKKGKAAPSVALSPDKTPRFPNPQSLSTSAPLTRTPSIGELYGEDSKESPSAASTVTTEKPTAAEKTTAPNPASPGSALKAVRSEPRAAHADLTADAIETAEEERAPDPRVVVVLPRLSMKAMVSILLVGAMAASALYLYSTSNQTGTQRLTSVSSVPTVGTEEAETSDQATSATDRNGSANEATSAASENSVTAFSPPTSPTASAEPRAKPDIPAAAPKATSTKQGQFAIQLISTKTVAGGQAAWNKLSGKYKNELSGLKLNLQTVTLQGRGEFVRVRAGPIQERQVAVNRCAALSAVGQDCLVVRF